MPPPSRPVHFAPWWLPVVLSLLFMACPQPTERIDRTIDSDRRPAPCPQALDLMSDNRFQEAVDLLMTRGAQERPGTTDPLDDICLGRALIGTGSYRQATGLLLPLQANDNLAVRTGACLYGAWASSAAGELDEARQLLDTCEAVQPLDLDSLLLPGDGTPGGLLLLDARSRRPQHLEALTLADDLLSAPAALDEPTRAWILERVFAVAGQMTPDQTREAADHTQPLVQAAAGFRTLELAIQEGQVERARALLPEVRCSLEMLDARAALLEVEEWLSGPASTSPALVGAILSLTGSYRRESRAVMAGLLLAQEAFREKSAPTSRLLIRDAGPDGRAAREVIALLDRQGALAVIAFVEPHLLPDLLDEAQRRHLPCIALTPDPIEGVPGSYLFRFFPDPVLEARLLATFAQEQGLAHLAVVIPLPTPDYLDTLVTSFADQACDAGFQVDEPLQYSTDDLQREAQTISQILAGRPFDGLLIADTGQRALTLTAYLGVQDIWSREPDRPLQSSERRRVLLLGNSLWHDPEFLSSGPDYLSGSVFPAWLPLETGHPAALRFAEEFTRLFARRPLASDAFAHDALRLLRFLLLETGLHTRDRIRDALEQMEGVDGATGMVHFGLDHTNQQPPHLLRVTSRGFVPR